MHFLLFHNRNIIRFTPYRRQIPATHAHLSSYTLGACPFQARIGVSWFSYAPHCLPFQTHILYPSWQTAYHILGCSVISLPSHARSILNPLIDSRSVSGGRRIAIPNVEYHVSEITPPVFLLLKYRKFFFCCHNTFSLISWFFFDIQNSYVIFAAPREIRFAEPESWA